MDSSHWRPIARLIAVLATLAGLAAWVVSGGETKQAEPGAATGSTRLVAVLGQDAPAATSSTQSSSEERIPILIDRVPTWVTAEDPKKVFAGAVAVDPVRNEIIVQTNEELMIYDRLANTPPAAKMTEPKRIIGGPKTKMADNCGLYVDWKTGQIYTIPNDIADVMVVFPPGAKGNVEPERELIVPHTVYGLAVDEESQEIFMAVGHPPAVGVFAKNAKGNDPLLRILEGDHTQLAFPHGIAVDPKNQLMYVTNHGSVASNKDGIGWGRWPIPSPEGGATRYQVPANRGRSYKYVDRGNAIPGSGRFVPPSITVYPLKASGDTSPVRVIQGPKTQLNWPLHIHMDAEHGELFVVNNIGDSILVFRATDSGDVAPLRVLKGPKTRIKEPTGVYVDSKNDELVVSNLRNYSATVYRRTASGDTPPLRIIRNAPLGAVAPALGQPTSIAYDAKRDEIIVPN